MVFRLENMLGGEDGGRGWGGRGEDGEDGGEDGGGVVEYLENTQDEVPCDFLEGGGSLHFAN